MPGINPDDYENCSVEELYGKLKGQSIHSTLYVRIKNVIDRKISASQEAHRAHELKEWAVLHKANLDLQADVRKIEKKVEQPKSEFRTWSLWVAIIALAWQIGEKLPWRSLLPSSSLPSAGAAPKTTPLAPVQAADNLLDAQKAPKASVETSEESNRATEPQSRPTPAEHPKD